MKSEKKTTRFTDTLEKQRAEINALEKQADTRSISKLIELFNSEIWHVRKLASISLVRINALANSSILESLDAALRKIRYKNEDTVYWAVHTASGIKAQAAGYLMKWAVDEEFPKNYMPHLMKALARVNDTSCISFLISALADENWMVRKEAVSALISFGRNIIPQLQSAFSSEKVEIRMWISKIMGQILGRDALNFFKNALQSERKEMRYYAISALSEIKEPAALSMIVSKIADPSWLIRVQAADVLEKIGAEALPYLKKTLAEGSSDEKHHAIKIIQRIARDGVFGIVRDTLNLDDTESKILSLSALSENYEKQSFNLLCDSLTDHNHLIQRHAANLMIQMGTPAIAQITVTFAGSQNETLRYWLIEVLNTFNTPEGFMAQKSIFNVASRREKIQIMQSITNTDEPGPDHEKAVFLIKALMDGGYSVRNAAFNQLVKFGYVKVMYDGGEVTLNDVLLKVRESGLEEPENECIYELVHSNGETPAAVSSESGMQAPPSGPAERHLHVQDRQKGHAARETFEAEERVEGAAGEALEFLEYSIKIDDILRKAVEMKASDVHLSVGYPPAFRVHGEVEFQEGFEPLLPGHTRFLAYQVLKLSVRRQFETARELDTSYEIKGLARFRVNAYMDLHGVGMVFRTIPYEVPDLDSLGVPPIIKALAEKEKGLVLVTGPTGSGKSTTLAAMINYINKNRKSHIITIEDPVEFLHLPVKSKVTQRELHTSTHSFANALRASLREDPDIILVGEMRDLETVELAITAAETGHLVLSTVHTASAANTIDRLIDVFPADKHSQVRTSLVEGLIAVVAQTLVPKKNGSGRIAAFEIMTMTNAIGNLIKEGKTSQIKDYMLAGKQYGMQILDDSLAELMGRDEVTFEEALSASYNKEDFKKRYGGSQAAAPNQQAGFTKPGFKKDFNDMDGGYDALSGLKPKTPPVKPKK